MEEEEEEEIKPNPHMSKSNPESTPQKANPSTPLLLSMQVTTKLWEVQSECEEEEIEGEEGQGDLSALLPDDDGAGGCDEGKASSAAGAPLSAEENEAKK